MGVRYKGGRSRWRRGAVVEKHEAEVSKRMRRTRRHKVFKLLMARGRSTASSKTRRRWRERRGDSREMEVWEERKRGSQGALQ